MTSLSVGPSVLYHLEREEQVVRVWADLFGFYLACSDIEKVLTSIIPLSQHLFWKNQKVAAVPVSHKGFETLILAGKQMVMYQAVGSMVSPPVPAEGSWYRTSSGKFFYLPTMEEYIDEKIFQRIKKDIDIDLT